MSKIQDRLKQYIDNKKISVREFCRKVNVSSSFLARDAEIASDKLLNIVNTFDDISIEWLITGEGEMMKQTGTLNEDRSAYQNKSEALLSIEEQRKLLDSYQSAQSEIESLKQEVKMKDKQLGDLIKTNLLLLEREKQGGISHNGVDSECASAG